MKTTFLLLKACLFGAFMLSGLSSGVFAQAYTESFDNIATLTGSGWSTQNNSSPLGIGSWFQGDPLVENPDPGPFDSHSGADSAYIAVNFRSVGVVGTINNWLFTPNRTFRNGDVFTFYTRKSTVTTGNIDYSDRLEVRLSTNGAGTNVGTSATDVGDFNTLLLSVNPALTVNVYPQVWTQYTVTIAGLPAPTSGRIAFRYFITNGGISGGNGDYIGIDDVEYTPYTCPAFTMTPGGALTGGAAGVSYSQALTQAGALGVPSFAITAGALPPGLTLAANGTISGTPTATGTFNFTATVSDASGCSGSQSYSITVVCAANPIMFPSNPGVCDDVVSHTLTEGLPGGGTYSGTGVVAGEFDPASGTQTITYSYTDPYGCSYSSDFTLTVNPVPTVAFTSPVTELCVNHEALTLSGGTPVGGTYSGAGVSGGILNPSTAGAGNHVITYSYTNASGCDGEATFAITVNACLGLNENQGFGLEIYPNPTTGKFTVNATGTDLFIVNVLNIQGKTISFDTSNTASAEVEMDLSSQVPGVYFVNGMVDGQPIKFRIQKQ